VARGIACFKGFLSAGLHEVQDDLSKVVNCSMAFLTDSNVRCAF